MVQFTWTTLRLFHLIRYPPIYRAFWCFLNNLTFHVGHYSHINTSYLILFKICGCGAGGHLGCVDTHRPECLRTLPLYPGYYQLLSPTRMCRVRPGYFLEKNKRTGTNGFLSSLLNNYIHVCCIRAIVM